jgi:hypothetical protein
MSFSKRCANPALSLVSFLLPALNPMTTATTGAEGSRDTTTLSPLDRTTDSAAAKAAETAPTTRRRQAAAPPPGKALIFCAP